MSTARERERQKRRRRDTVRTGTATQVEAASEKTTEKPPATVPMPQWKWLTFPVFMALAFGLFVGVWLGVPAGVANEDGNGTAVTILYLGTAILLGVALSRFSVRWLQSRNWIKPRPAKKR